MQHPACSGHIVTVIKSSNSNHRQILCLFEWLLIPVIKNVDLKSNSVLVRLNPLHLLILHSFNVDYTLNFIQTASVRFMICVELLVIFDTISFLHKKSIQIKNLHSFFRVSKFSRKLSTPFRL